MLSATGLNKVNWGGGDWRRAMRIIQSPYGLLHYSHRKMDLPKNHLKHHPEIVLMKGETSINEN